MCPWNDRPMKPIVSIAFRLIARFGPHYTSMQQVWVSEHVSIAFRLIARFGLADIPPHTSLEYLVSIAFRLIARFGQFEHIFGPTHLRMCLNRLSANCPFRAHLYKTAALRRKAGLNRLSANCPFRAIGLLSSFSSERRWSQSPFG